MLVLRQVLGRRSILVMTYDTAIAWNPSPLHQTKIKEISTVVSQGAGLPSLIMSDAEVVEERFLSPLRDVGWQMAAADGAVRLHSGSQVCRSGNANTPQDISELGGIKRSTRLRNANRRDASALKHNVHNGHRLWTCRPDRKRG